MRNSFFPFVVFANSALSVWALAERAGWCSESVVRISAKIVAIVSCDSSIIRRSLTGDFPLPEGNQFAIIILAVHCQGFWFRLLQSFWRHLSDWLWVLIWGTNISEREASFKWSRERICNCFLVFLSVWDCSADCEWILKVIIHWVSIYPSTCNWEGCTFENL